ncbi:MAG: phosphoserine phosphatase SerB [Candidatus Altiarchaeales archaeon ex4484_43]|nr:MAG: phosphoserine phosphatase SerB [Candidatus Altiarchaeales archaeon ex4484_43]
MEDSLFVITVLGKDREGLVAGITGELAAVNVNIVDIEQSVIHGLFSMFMLIDISKARINADKIKAIVYESSRELGVDINITPLSEYGEKYNEKEKKIQKITIVGRDKPGIVAGISRALSDLNMNIERIKMIARGDLLAMEMLADSKGLSLDKLKEVMKKTGDKIGVDVIVQSEDISRSRKRLVLFDMDGTIVDSEIIDELAKAAGVGKEVSELTAQGMRGEIDFEESLKKRVAMLKGLSESTLQRIRDEMKLTPGAEELINALKSMGYKIALISGGFTYFTDALKERLGFDYVYANDLVIKDGKVTGEIRGRIIRGSEKGSRRQHIKKQPEGIDVLSRHFRERSEGKIIILFMVIYYPNPLLFGNWVLVFSVCSLYIIFYSERT